jgi:hypothetical protein
VSAAGYEKRPFEQGDWRIFVDFAPINLRIFSMLPFKFPQQANRELFRPNRETESTDQGKIAGTGIRIRQSPFLVVRVVEKCNQWEHALLKISI